MCMPGIKKFVIHDWNNMYHEWLWPLYLKEKAKISSPLFSIKKQKKLNEESVFLCVYLPQLVSYSLCWLWPVGVGIG